ncbi:MAG TPA: AgmX/PglI C-terminal domain-containing protein [Polyangiaceae bacterium]|jgi:TonB family protein
MRLPIFLALAAVACGGDAAPPPRTEVAVEAPRPAPLPSVEPGAPDAGSVAADESHDVAVDGTDSLEGADGGVLGGVVGGTGEGMGLGNLGGHGSGSGQGYGTGHGRLGTGGGHLEPEVIRSVVRAHMQGLKLCYEKALVKHPDLGGRVMVSFVIAPSGSVRSAFAAPNSTLHDADAVACVLARVGELQFPAPNGGEVHVNYPFVFAAAGP